MTRGLLLALVLWVAPLSRAEAQEDLFGDIRSTMDGVYTKAQADAGAETWDAVCSECHAREDHAGRDFLGVWAGQPLYALWQFITTRMPFGAPGSLSPEQYAEVVAYVLRLNGFPAGAELLPHEPFEVAGIDLVLPPDSQPAPRR